MGATRGGEAGDHSAAERATLLLQPGGPEGESTEAPGAVASSSSVHPGATTLDLAATEGLRGYAAAAVVLGHILFYWVPAWDVPLGTFSGAWPAFGLEFLSAVTLFVVLSGFTLVQGYDASLRAEEVVAAAEAGAAVEVAAEPAAPAFAWRPYLIRRLARLAPIYYLGLLIGLGPFLVYAPDVASLVASAVLTPLGLQSFAPVSGVNWDGPLWTVSALLLCYSVFPPALRRLSRCTSRALLAWLCGLSALSAAVMGLWLTLIPEGWASATILHLCGPFRLPQFMVGVCAGILTRRHPMPPWAACACAEAVSVVLLVSLGLCAWVTAAAGHGNGEAEVVARLKARRLSARCRCVTVVCGVWCVVCGREKSNRAVALPSPLERAREANTISRNGTHPEPEPGNSF